MARPQFAGAEYLTLPLRGGGQVRVYRDTWIDHIVKGHGHQHLDLNFDLVAATLRDPDEIRSSTKSAKSSMYYRRCDSYEISDGITVPTPKRAGLMVVVVKDSRFVQTAYLTDKPKRGKTLWRRPAS